MIRSFESELGKLEERIEEARLDELVDQADELIQNWIKIRKERQMTYSEVVRPLTSEKGEGPGGLY